ncbi:MAG: hypothetical protein JNM27_00790 [Leptospirales bacterium]|nr:hypothetical protein [Leptospirales bacterium]
MLILFLAVAVFGIALARNGSSYTYTSDSLIKYIQTVSLLRSSYQSEALFYPGLSLDPGYQFYPFTKPNVLVIGDKHIGQYPLMLSFVMSGPAALLPAAAMPYLCLGVALAALGLFWKLFRSSAVTLAFAAFGTPLITQGMELSENPLLILLGLVGLYFYVRAVEEGQLRDAALAGFLSAVGIWFRLEALLYSLSLLCAWILVTIRNKPLKQYAAFGIASTLTVGAFLVFQTLHYGHPLGPRFIANPTSIDLDLLRLAQVFTLIFGWKFKLGQFGFSPLLLIPIVYFVLTRTRDQLVRLLVVFQAGFLLAASFLAPNDGVVTWGSRYLYLALYPALLLLDRFYRDAIQHQSRLRRVGFFAVFTYSILICILTLAIQRKATQELKALQTELKQAKGDVIIMPGSLLTSYAGLLYFERPILSPSGIEAVPELAAILRTHGPMRITLTEYTGWTAQEFATRLDNYLGRDLVATSVKAFGGFQHLESHKLTRLTLHEYQVK